MRTVIASLHIAALLAVLGADAVIYAGVYDIGATAPHWRITSWLLETARTRSIKAQAVGIAVPPGLDDPEKLVIGVEHYAAHCAVCHGAPGVPKGDIARGLYPPPPDLAKTVPLFSPAELFWIVKHGIKMTGMPAWNSWPIVAGPLPAAWLRPKQTDLVPDKGSSARVSTIRSAIVVRQRFFGIFWPLFFGRLRAG
jgi:mono/diheme cytochrome c family protein